MRGRLNLIQFFCVFLKKKNEWMYRPCHNKLVFFVWVLLTATPKTFSLHVVSSTYLVGHFLVHTCRETIAVERLKQPRRRLLTVYP